VNLTGKLGDEVLIF